MAQPFPYSDAPCLPQGTDLDPGLLIGAGNGPVEIEIGPGRGGFIFERLSARPEVRILGLEIRRKWAFLVDQRLRDQGLGHRARVFAEDARFALPRFKAETAHAVFFHFPDPWWKRRQRKRKVGSTDVFAELARILVPGGELFYQTDVFERAEEAEALLSASPDWEPWNGRSARVADNPHGAMSPRERRAAADGLPIARLRYVRAVRTTP